jgi:segregation and condensation protein A
MMDDSQSDLAGDAFIVDLDGYEGPLDLLLDLARKQKIDLSRLSMLALVRQYLSFIESAKAKRLDIAADYLVMAAWLTYLKSRLLVPKPAQDDEPTGEELAETLAARLRHLEFIRKLAGLLDACPQLGRDSFARPVIDPVDDEPADQSIHWHMALHDLVHAYASQRQKTMVHQVTIKPRQVISLKEARDRLALWLGNPQAANWLPLASLMESFDQTMPVSSLASAFAASLEMVREGHILLRQDRPFAPLMVKSCSGDRKPA